MKQLLQWIAVSVGYAYLLFLFWKCVYNEPLLTWWLKDESGLADFLSIMLVAMATALYLQYTGKLIYKDFKRNVDNEENNA